MGPELVEFIRMGLTKEKWPHITTELIAGFIDNPLYIDAEDEDFVEAFYHYHDWWWDLQK